MFLDSLIADGEWLARYARDRSVLSDQASARFLPHISLSQLSLSPGIQSAVTTAANDNYRDMTLRRDICVFAREGNVIPWELIENQITATHDYEASAVKSSMQPLSDGLDSLFDAQANGHRGCAVLWYRYALTVCLLCIRWQLH